MPKKGAFDQKDVERFSVVQREKLQQDAELKSAIPPAPNEGEPRVSADERRRRERLLVVAALAALLLVGGTTLYIARPWDPTAYRTHATEDADTSMEGFPGEKPHLSSQDLIEEEEYKQVVAANGAYLDSAYQQLGELGDEAKQARDDFMARLDQGSAAKDAGDGASVSRIQQDLGDVKTQLQGMDVKEAQQKKKRDELLVLVDYLSGATDVLASARSALVGNESSSNSVPYARGIVNGGVGARGFDEWYELFRNAYQSQSK